MVWFGFQLAFILGFTLWLWFSVRIFFWTQYPFKLKEKQITKKRIVLNKSLLNTPLKVETTVTKNRNLLIFRHFELGSLPENCFRLEIFRKALIDQGCNPKKLEKYDKVLLARLYQGLRVTDESIEHFQGELEPAKQCYINVFLDTSFVDTAKMDNHVYCLRLDIWAFVLDFVLNTLLPGVPFLYPLKTSENCRFSDVFKEYKKVTSSSNALRNIDMIMTNLKTFKISLKKTLLIRAT